MRGIIEEERKEPPGYSIGMESKVIVMMQSHSLEIRRVTLLDVHLIRKHHINILHVLLLHPVHELHASHVQHVVTLLPMEVTHLLITEDKQPLLVLSHPVAARQALLQPPCRQKLVGSHCFERLTSLENPNRHEVKATWLPLPHPLRAVEQH
jgi:hypothetical protein